MKHIFSIMIAALFLYYPSIAFTAIKEIVSEGTYNMGDGETPSVAESRALLNAYLGRGFSLAIKKQFSRAIEDLNRAIDLNPKKSDAYNVRGMVYAEIGNPRAISDFQKACDMGSEKGCSFLQKALQKR